MTSLRTAFDAYAQLVASKTERLRAGPRSRGVLTDLSKPERQLHDIVESLEKGAEFKELVRATRSAFPDHFYSTFSGDAWVEPVRQFFRRSDAYSQYLGEPETGAATQFAKFEDALKQEKMCVQFLAPLEFVSFSRDLNCGSFFIRRFLREELDNILQTKVNEIFSPHAVADTAQLSQYWFLFAAEQQFVGPHSVLHTKELGNIPASYQPPPGPIEKALQVLSLFDWGRWGGFRLPFVIVTYDNLLRAPCRWWCAGRWAVAPDCSRLLKSGKRAILDEDASSQLENFSRETGSIVAQYSEKHPWHFFEIAITYFERAFQTEGLDQYLWYMVAIEALVGGDPPEPVLTTICRRLARMFGVSKKKMKDKFEPLYNVRCDMVHGRALGSRGKPSIHKVDIVTTWAYQSRPQCYRCARSIDGTIYQADNGHCYCSPEHAAEAGTAAESQAQDAVIGSLPGRTRVTGSLLPARVAELRQLAREAIVWFAPRLAHLRRRCPSDDLSLLPSRARLLSALDFDERLHVLEGLKIALAHPDAVISLIRQAQRPAVAKTGLMQQFQLSEIQAQAILDMRLQRLTGLEREKILEEHAETTKQIPRYKEILEILVDERKV